jgi:hypothetical protein
VHSKEGAKQDFMAAAVVAGLLLVGLGYRQGNLQSLAQYPVALARRGENWREAVRWVNEAIEKGDRVYLDADLIESRRLSRSNSPPLPRNHLPIVSPEPIQSLTEYLRFPVRGPYMVDGPVGLYDLEADVILSSVDPIIDQAPVTTNVLGSGGQSYTIVRRPAIRLPRVHTTNRMIIPFGGVSILVEPSSLAPDR